MTYVERLAGRGLKIGDQVVCDFRLPTPHQFWIHPFWVGVIEAPSEKPGKDGAWSEARLCRSLNAVRVRFLGGPGDGPLSTDWTVISDLGHLVQLHFGTVERSPQFVHGQERALYEFACRCGYGDRYSLLREVAA